MPCASTDRTLPPKLSLTSMDVRSAGEAPPRGSIDPILRTSVSSIPRSEVDEAIEFCYYCDEHDNDYDNDGVGNGDNRCNMSESWRSDGTRNQEDESGRLFNASPLTQNTSQLRMNVPKPPHTADDVTVAIKPASMGHDNHQRDHHMSRAMLEAERNDRISRLAGLERVATSRPQPNTGAANPPPGYFDSTVPQIREKSTVGSASATGSVGGRTEWANESVDYTDADKMSEDQDDGISSTSGLRDEEDNVSLVGFGEGASSTMSGPISTAAARAQARHNILNRQSGTPMSGVVSTGAGGSQDPRMMDGMSYDRDIVDTTMQTAQPVGPQGQRYSGAGADFAETVMRDRLAAEGQRPMGTPDSQGLGKFPFEK